MSAQGTGFGVYSSRVTRNTTDGSLGVDAEGNGAVTDASRWFAFPSTGTAIEGQGSVSTSGEAQLVLALQGDA